MKHKFSAVICILLLWQLIAVGTNNSYIFPSVGEVGLRMLQMLQLGSFYNALLYTFVNILLAIMIAFVLALTLSYLAYKHTSIEEIASPIISIFQAIPNISFIILALVWTGSIQTVYLVLMLVLFPLFYHNFLEGFKAIDVGLCDAIILYNPPFFYKIFSVYLPLIKPSLVSGLKSALSMGIKVGVMAEILAQTDGGVGRAMNYCRINFDMVGLFTWTAWLVVIILLLETLLNYGIRKSLAQ